MSPRRYDRRLRQAASEEARRRIVEAAAALHADHGGLGTSHAMIARRAGVSIPTVYKYFPGPNDLIPACTGLVASRAPLALDERILEGHSRLPERVLALARALFRLHEYFAPWLRWSEAEASALPALRTFLEGGRKAQHALIRRALVPPGAPPLPKARLLLAQVLLDYPSWRSFTEGGETSESAAVIVTDAIVKLARPARPSWKGGPL
jgi:AcrR family transcriptional regulator